MPCSNAAKTQNPLKFVGVPQTPEPISAVSGPKFTILPGHVEEILLLNKFFSDCRYVPWLRRYSPTNLWDGAQMVTFWQFFACCIFSEPRSTFQTCILNLHQGHTITMCGSMVDIQSPTAEIRRGKKGRKKKKPQDENIYGLAYYIGRP